jgi:hypothetical protein
VDATRHASFGKLAHQVARRRRQTTAFRKLLTSVLDFSDETLTRRRCQAAVQNADQLLLLFVREMISRFQDFTELQFIGDEISSKS